MTLTMPAAIVGTLGFGRVTVAIEDSRFYEHGSLDLQGVGRALLSNLRGGNTQGASTLTQQYVKITLQENALRNLDPKAVQAATTRSNARKLEELKNAVTLEKTETKDQILQGYLNLVYCGGQAYGVEAAARHFFGVHASQLNLPQAATLAGLVQAPSVTDPIRSLQRAGDAAAARRARAPCRPTSRFPSLSRPAPGLAWWRCTKRHTSRVPLKDRHTAIASGSCPG